MKKGRKFFVAYLILGIVMWLSLFNIRYAEAIDETSLEASETLTALSQTEVSKLKNLVKSINTTLNEAGLFREITRELGSKHQSVKNKDFIFIESEKDNSIKTDVNNDASAADSYYVTITCDWKTYNAYEKKQQQKVYQIVLSKLQDTNEVSAMVRTKVYNYFMDSDETTSQLVRQLSTDVTADYGTAYARIKPFTRWVSMIMGILAICIFMFLTISMLLDIAYIVIPTFQLFSDDRGESGVSVGKINLTIFKISQEAVAAVKQAESGNGNAQPPLTIYFKSKVKQVFVIGICILYLGSGEIYTLLASFIDMLTGFLPS